MKIIREETLKILLIPVGVYAGFWILTAGRYYLGIGPISNLVVLGLCLKYFRDKNYEKAKILLYFIFVLQFLGVFATIFYPFL